MLTKYWTAMAGVHFGPLSPQPFRQAMIGATSQPLSVSTERI